MAPLCRLTYEYASADRRFPPLVVQARADDVVEVNPLIPADKVSHCAVDHVSYHGHTLAIVWDRDGSHYGKGKGLSLFIDGKLASSSPTIARITAQLPTRA